MLKAHPAARIYIYIYIVCYAVTGDITNIPYSFNPKGVSELPFKANPHVSGWYERGGVKPAKTPLGFWRVSRPH